MKEIEKICLSKTRALNKGEANLIQVQTNTDEREAGQDGPVLDFQELIKFTKVGRSSAYKLMNPDDPAFDPDFPSGFPLFDSPRSPKVYWRHEALAWLEGRDKKRTHNKKKESL